VRVLIDKLAELLHREDGPAATEYAVLLSLVIVAAVITIGFFGTRVNELFADVVAAGW